MKFEVKYPGQPAHEVERKGPLITLGRDPTCDLVLNDERCSRRHAVVETTPDGLVVRDAGSANGVFVNGKKIERAALRTGDLLRIGEVILEVLAEESAGTVIVAPHDLLQLGTAPAQPAVPTGPSRLGTDKAPRPPMREQKTTPAQKGRETPLPARATRRPPPGRPFTVTVLASLWVASVILYSVLSLVAMSKLELQGISAIGALSSGIVMSLLSVLMAYGLWTLRPWARLLQAGLAVLGLVLCPFTLASATVLIYVLRPATRAAFGDLSVAGGEDGSSETTFGLTLIGTVLLGGVVCTAAALFLAFQA